MMAKRRSLDKSWPWRQDFASLDATERRAARYALQMVARCTWLRRRLDDEDFLKPLWALTRCLFDPDKLELLQRDWSRRGEPSERHATAHEEDDEWGLLLPRRSKRGDPWQLPGGVPGVRMRTALIGYFSAVPDAVLARLAADDGRTPTRHCIQVLVACAGLDQVEGQMLDFVVKRETLQAFPCLLRETGTLRVQHHLECLSAAFDCPASAVAQRLEPTRALKRLGLLRRGDLAPDLEDYLDTENLFVELLAHDPQDRDALLAALIDPAPQADFALADFPHLGTEAQRLTTVLGQGAKGGAVGINVLLYGAPGSGKTQFALAVAQAAGLQAYVVRYEGAKGQAMARTERLGAYQLAQQLLRTHANAVLIFDEVEDVFADSTNILAMLLGGDAKAHGEKGWMNRVLEENPVPAIWITNDAASIDPAFRRRFLLPVAFAAPPGSVRRKMVGAHLAGVDVPESLLDELAADAEMMPSSFGAARRLVTLCADEPPEAVIRGGVAATRRLLLGAAAPRLRLPTLDFDVAYLNLAGGIAPGRLADALSRSGRGTLCFYGPPGTGKTEFAHVLADALDRELVVKASSDLVSSYLGETERNIARLFNELDPEHSLLLLDEVDSLLRDRGQAQRSWELTQVNELLQQMERFNGIFIAATNLMTQLDGAAMRRFDFKLAFRPLSEAQRLSLFAREALGDGEAIDLIPAPLARRLASLHMLTPGDFANVVRQRTLLGEVLEAEEFLRRLVLECRHKGDLVATAQVG